MTTPPAPAPPRRCTCTWTRAKPRTPQQRIPDPNCRLHLGT